MMDCGRSTGTRTRQARSRATSSAPCTAWTPYDAGPPYFPIEFDGVSIGRGLLWLFIIDPIVMTVAYWIFMLVVLPVIGLAVGAGAIADRRKQE